MIRGRARTARLAALTAHLVQRPPAEVPDLPQLPVQLLTPALQSRQLISILRHAAARILWRGRSAAEPASMRLTWASPASWPPGALRLVSLGSYKPFLHHVTKGRPGPDEAGQAHGDAPVHRTLDAGQVAAILAAGEHLRDRFLFALVAEKGCASARRSACGTATWAAPAGDPHRAPPRQRQRGPRQAAGVVEYSCV
jgi:hypothetical protein